jgi:hypothetical protein
LRKAVRRVRIGHVRSGKSVHEIPDDPGNIASRYSPTPPSRPSFHQGRTCDKSYTHIFGWPRRGNERRAELKACWFWNEVTGKGLLRYAGLLRKPTRRDVRSGSEFEELKLSTMSPLSGASRPNPCRHGIVEPGFQAMIQALTKGPNHPLRTLRQGVDCHQADAAQQAARRAKGE